MNTSPILTPTMLCLYVHIDVPNLLYKAMVPHIFVYNTYILAQNDNTHTHAKWCHAFLQTYVHPVTTRTLTHAIQPFINTVVSYFAMHLLMQCLV